MRLARAASPTAKLDKAQAIPEFSERETVDEYAG